MRPNPNPFHLPIEPGDPTFASVALEGRFGRFWSAKERSWRLFRIDIDRREYVRLYVECRGCCGICGTFWRVDGRLLCPDHVHDGSRRVRGLLCDRCNRELGRREMLASCNGRLRWIPKEVAYLCRSNAGVELLQLGRL